MLYVCILQNGLQGEIEHFKNIGGLIHESRHGIKPNPEVLYL